MNLRLVTYKKNTEKVGIYRMIRIKSKRRAGFILSLYLKFKQNSEQNGNHVNLY